MYMDKRYPDYRRVKFPNVTVWRPYTVKKHNWKDADTTERDLFSQMVKKHYPAYRDLAFQQGRSRSTGKLFVSYELSVTFHSIFITLRQDLASKLVEMFSSEALSVRFRISRLKKVWRSKFTEATFTSVSFLPVNLNIWLIPPL